MDKMQLLMRCGGVAYQSKFGKILNLRSAYVLGCGNIRNYCEPAKTETAGKPDDSHRAPVLRHRPSDWDKRMLVWTKKFKSIEDVPETVSRETMEQAKSRSRIKINIYMMGVTTLICVLMIMWGRHDAHKGESVHKMNLEWHKNYKESSDK